jgi:hypothetical protein
MLWFNARAKRLVLTRFNAKDAKSAALALGALTV